MFNIEWGKIMNENLTKVKINRNEGIIELEGSEEFVQNNIDGFKDFIYKSVSEPTKEEKLTTGITKKSDNGVIKQSKSSVVDNVPPEEFDIRGNETAPSFRNFLDDIKPSNSAADLIAVTGFYFKQHLNKEEFSEGNVMYVYGIAGAKRPKKVHQTFHDTKSRKQWIKQGSASDKWILTHIGEDYILHDISKSKN